MCVCASLTVLCLFVGLSVSLPESAHDGLGELLSSGTSVTRGLAYMHTELLRGGEGHLCICAHILHSSSSVFHQLEVIWLPHSKE